MTRDEIVTTARSYIGTPFHHQARLPGVGLDCVGVVICVARAHGVIPGDWDRTGYSRRADGHTLVAELSANMTRIRQDQMQAGDVVCVGFDVDPQHVGILADYRHGGFSIIHAVGLRGAGVTETRLMFSRAMWFVAAFCFPGVA